MGGSINTSAALLGVDMKRADQLLGQTLRIQLAKLIWNVWYIENEHARTNKAFSLFLLGSSKHAITAISSVSYAIARRISICRRVEREHMVILHE